MGTAHEGQVVVVTGAGRGIGRAIAERFAGAGAHVVVNDIETDLVGEVVDQITTAGGNATGAVADVSDSAQVATIFETTLDAYGTLDVLVNNAGIVRGQGATSIWEITDEDWRLGIDTNMSSAFYCSRAIAKHMVERGQGKIINVSSGFGFRGGRDNYMYCVGKGGIVQLTRALTTSLSRYGITSTCIVPGFLPTEGTDESRLTLPRGEFIPIGRVGHPHELGAVAVFLASSGSDYMNGEVFSIDGGGLAGGFAPTGYAPEIPLEV